MTTGHAPVVEVYAHAPEQSLREIVVCSLEPWDEVWRRNQFLVDGLLKRNPELRVLFVEPPTDPLFDLASRRRPALPRVRRVTPDGRLRAFRPLKPLPRKLGPASDAALLAQVRLAARAMRFARPILWINDVTYAPLIERTGWPSVYDVTDDWLLATPPGAELERLRRLDALATRTADEVVVCSPALATSRGAARSVNLVPNGVDVEHLRRPRGRPGDLPIAPTAVYLGSLHDARIDVELIVDIAERLPEVSIVFVGPSSLEESTQRVLDALPNVVLLGRRPYDDVPAYLQHADVVVVPHRVSTFSESLDPIKLYECLAIDTPTVATRVAGFREHDDDITVVDRENFPAAVASALASGHRRVPGRPPLSWRVRTEAFEDALQEARRNRPYSDHRGRRSDLEVSR